jgi:uncharacterized membrane protein YvbJ
MSHKAVGTVTIDHQVTTIRKYDNGFYAVEVNADVQYSGESLADLEKKLLEDRVTYTISDRT